VSDALDSLVEILDLEPIEVNIFRGVSPDEDRQRVFGGQVAAQALMAAGRTVEVGRPHSLHAYFLRPGDPTVPILYEVDRIRDGRSFTTRRVVAIQHGRAIFNMSASFHVAEPGPEHQEPMPAVPPPESVEPELDLIRGIADRIPESLRAVLTQDRPLDFRPVDPVDPFSPSARPPLKYMWVRAQGRLPDETLSHQAVLAYASDYGLLATALLPHALSIRTPGLQVATLDHAVWFHRPFRADEWLLIAMDSPAAYGARGFARASVFTRDGRLVASLAQEGLTRVRAEPRA